MTQLNADNCYIFTDTETSGLDINFSQIIQVGSLLTDENLVVEEEQNLSSKLLPWIIPSPEALLVHKRSECLDDSGPSHYEMMIELRNEWLEWSKERNPIFITYNGHRFDEELFRRQFYWCLLPPYITNTGGAKRLDLMYTLQIVANFFPDSISIPCNDEGEISLKLTDWAESNNISSVNAHDALADSYLMVSLSRIIAERAKQAWESSLIGSSKDGNLRLLQKEPFSMLGEVIRKKKFTYPVTFCAQNPKFQNEVAVVDLYFDPDVLNDLSDSELLEQISTAGTAIRKLRINKSLPLINSLDIPNIQQKLDIPLEQLERRAYKIRDNVKLQSRIRDLLSLSKQQYPPPKFVEQSVYSGFSSSEDELWMERFHLTPWKERSELIDGFEDSRYRELAERLICSHSLNDVSKSTKDKYETFINKRLFDKGPWLNVSEAQEKIKKLLKQENISEKEENKEILIKLQKKLSLIANKAHS